MENEVTEKLTEIIVFDEPGSLPKLSSQQSSSLEPSGKDRGQANALKKSAPNENVVKIFSADKIELGLKPLYLIFSYLYCFAVIHDHIQKAYFAKALKN